MAPKVKDHNYAQIHGWMINEYNLSGNSLLLFGIIFGFSQDGQSYFYGSLNYLSAFLNCAKQTTINSLHLLIEKGLIEKNQIMEKNVTKSGYRISQEVVQFLDRGSQKIRPAGSLNFRPPSDIESNKELDNYKKKILEELNDTNSKFSKQFFKIGMRDFDFFDEFFSEQESIGKIYPDLSACKQHFLNKAKRWLVQPATKHTTPMRKNYL